MKAEASVIASWIDLFSGKRTLYKQQLKCIECFKRQLYLTSPPPPLPYKLMSPLLWQKSSWQFKMSLQTWQAREQRGPDKSSWRSKKRVSSHYSVRLSLLYPSWLSSLPKTFIIYIYWLWICKLLLIVLFYYVIIYFLKRIWKEA